MRPKILPLKQLLQKTYDYLEGLPPEFEQSFGKLSKNFSMIVWGNSANGKTNLLMQIIKVLLKYGKVLYISLEEGHEASMQMHVLRHLQEVDAHNNMLQFADHTMTYDALMLQLAKKKQAQFIIIDSVQYWNITYLQYCKLKERFPKKSFIFISHADGKNPKDSTAKSIRYDVPVKVHVDRFIAFVGSRFGGNKNYIINHDLAKKAWGKQYKKHANQ